MHVIHRQFVAMLPATLNTLRPVQGAVCRMSRLLEHSTAVFARDHTTASDRATRNTKLVHDSANGRMLNTEVFSHFRQTHTLHPVHALKQLPIARDDLSMVASVSHGIV